MDFRLIVLSLSLWLIPAYGNTMTELDELAHNVYQYPNKTLTKIQALEQRLDQEDTSEENRLRLSILKCEAFVQLGENEAAINLGRMSEAKAKSNKLNQLGPYFLNCMAAAYMNYGDLRQALTLLDSAIFQSREQQQPQSLVNGLMLRGKIDTHIESQSSALEDLRLAQDIYPDTEKQQPQWLTPPRPYIQLAMAELLRTKGLYNQAFNYAKGALDSEQTTGKVRLTVLLALAKVAHYNQEVKFRDDMVLEAKILLPELATATELAESYTQLAEIEFLRGNDKSAIQLLNIALNTFDKQKKINDSLRANRLLANIHLANGEQALGTELMQKAIAIGERTNQFDELVYCYGILSRYFADIAQYQEAYQYQLKRFEMAQRSYEFLKDTRLLQIKAQLGRYQQLAQANQPKPIKLDAHISDSYGLIGILVLFLLLTLFILLNRIRTPKATLPQSQRDEPMSTQEKMEALLASAKQIGFPITILLINSSHLAMADYEKLQARLAQKIRQQDILLSTSADQILIMLPFTSLPGAQLIGRQLSAIIEPLQNGTRVSMGMAVMQHHDTLSSLVKRASVDQLSKYSGQQAH
ncbi:tetratricopeptide repeat protein [Shewanella sp.]|uniref:tetratricopeptide repeat protein n=1 Tax=Shewanella sp. TaxID=50422 RepID=UPI003D120C62